MNNGEMPCSAWPRIFRVPYFHTVKFIKNISFEPAFFLFMLAHGFYVMAAQELYRDKVCRVNLNFTSEICDNINHHREQQVQVQKYVTDLKMINRCVFHLSSHYVFI